MSPTRKSPETFESAFSELQHVVEQLETGGLDLDHMLRLYQRGSELTEVCTRLLDAAELRVTRLTPESASPLADIAADP